MNRLDELVQLADRGRQFASVRPRSGSRDWYRIRAAAGDRAAVYIYDFIDPWGVTAADFVAELNAITAPAIDLHINSGGGLVWDAVAIHAALRNHAATVDVSIDGLAASAASFVAMSGDSITIEKPAKMMIHDAMALVYGNAAEMTAAATLLDEISNTIAGIYADRAGGTVEHWRTAMQAETWYGSAAAVEAGLADRIANDSTSTQAAPDDRRSQLIRARARVMALRGVA